MKRNELSQKLINFLDQSVSSYHATDSIKKKLIESGYEELKEDQDWDIEPHQGYFVVRGDSSIIAFRLGKTDLAKSGLRIFGAHTDSPHLKLKPKPLIHDHQSVGLGVEVYGGVLLQSWFDRDLGVSGRVSGIDGKGNLKSTLLKTDFSIGSIPRLAIHLDRQANVSGVENTQVQLNPIIKYSSSKNDKFNFLQFIKSLLPSQKKGSLLKEILSYDLGFYDFQSAQLIGVDQKVIASARLDNLISCFAISEAFSSKANIKNSQSTLMVCHDHEEVGSGSYVGANGSFVEDVLSRIEPDSLKNKQMRSNSIFLSIDNSHACHPNYADKHDRSHQIFLGDGPAIKYNANQKYATNSETAAWLKHSAKKAKVNIQEFVSKNDIPCGSTIGPMSSARLGIKTLDLGVPSLAMHSIRELAHIDDIFDLYKVLKSII